MKSNEQRAQASTRLALLRAIGQDPL